MTAQRAFLGLAVVAAVVVAGCSAAGTPASPSPSAAGESTAAVAPTTTPDTTSTAVVSPSETPAPAASSAPNATQSAVPADTDLSSWDPPVSVDEAIAKAQGVAQGTVHEVELTYASKPKAWVYEVAIQQDGKDTTVIVDATIGDVLDQHTEKVVDLYKAIDLTVMSPAAAMKAAQAVVEGTVASWTLEWDDGGQKYTVEIRTGRSTEDVRVDPATGSATADD